jgi:hypothetical protein
VIAFGSAVVDEEAYRRFAEPGIRRAAEPDSGVIALAAVGPIARGLNLVLDAAARLEGLEALVLVAPRAEIADRELCAKLRAAFADPAVGVVGCAGATGVRSIAWWEGEVSAGPVRQRYSEHGGGELPAYAWAPRRPAGAEVDAVDGFLMALSPWVVRNVRFDEAHVLEHGFDVDFCLQVRQAGRRIVTADVAAVHHRSLELVEDHELWVEAHIGMAGKWGPRLGADEPDEDAWRRRARRAEAEREAARTLAYSNRLRVDARVLQLERELAVVTSSPSWRVTAPLRRLNAWRRSRRG